MTTTPLHIVQTTGAADFLGPANGNRRFWVPHPLPLHEFRITAPGKRPIHGLFPNAKAARQLAEGLYPDSHPASVVCTSRQREEARQ